MNERRGEFDLIARYFGPLAGPESLQLGDDAAILTPPPGESVVVTCDMMVAGVHFLPHDPPDAIGAKLLAVNLSDLAAMGADPAHYFWRRPGLSLRRTPGWTDSVPDCARCRTAMASP